MSKGDYERMKKEMQNHIQNTLGKKYAPVFESGVRIHTPEIPSKDLSDYIESRQETQRRLIQETTELEDAQKEATDFHENKIERKRIRKERWLTFCNIWKWLIYLLWIGPVIIDTYSYIRADLLLVKIEELINRIFSLDISLLQTIGIWVGLLLVFKFLSRIRIVLLRLFINFIFFLIFGFIVAESIYELFPY